MAASDKIEKIKSASGGSDGHRTVKAAAQHGASSVAEAALKARESISGKSLSATGKKATAADSGSPVRDHPVDEVEKKQVSDHLHDKYQEVAGREVEEGKPDDGETGTTEPPNAAAAQEALSGTDGYDNLSQADKDQLLALYEAHPSQANLDSLVNLVKEGHISKKSLEDLAAIGSADNPLAEGMDREEMFTRALDLYEQHPTANNLASLRTLAEDGRIDDSVLDGLEALGNQEFALAEGVDREELFSTALGDIANPARISQGGKGTCAATTMQIALAVKDPGRYLETVRLLASESGDASAIVPGLARDEGTPIDGTGDSRSLTVRLMAPAFMEYANGSLDYRNADDASFDANGEEDHSGLYPSESTRLFNALLEIDGTNLSVNDENRDDVYQQVKDAVAAGCQVPVGLDWNGPDNEGGGHRILVDHIETDPDTGQEYVYIMNPHGRLQKLTAEDFKNNMLSATIHDEAVDVNKPSNVSDNSVYSLKDIPDPKPVEEPPVEDPPPNNPPPNNPPPDDPSLWDWFKGLFGL